MELFPSYCLSVRQLSQQVECPSEHQTNLSQNAFKIVPSTQIRDDGDCQGPKFVTCALTLIVGWPRARFAGVSAAVAWPKKSRTRVDGCGVDVEERLAA